MRDSFSTPLRANRVASEMLRAGEDYFVRLRSGTQPLTGTVVVLIGAAISAISGFVGAIVFRGRPQGIAIAAALQMIGCLTGLAGLAAYLIQGGDAGVTCASPWAGTSLTAQIDGLSAFFLAPVLVICGLASLYGTEYWSIAGGAKHPHRVSIFLGLMTSGMVLLLVAADGIVFLFGWEIMAVSAWFLVAAEDDLASTRNAAWIYIAASHLATVCVIGVFALVKSETGSLGYAALPDSTSTAAVWIAILALLGFGTKAGLMPVHVWLPGAHASAPSHVSAVMSGVMIKMGIYGLMRTSSWFPQIPLSWALGVLALGTVSAVLGVAFAISQHDIKRLLAYHSIENIGIITMGWGVALLGRATGNDQWVVLGMAGGCLHVWNHAIFKSLLFFGAGSIIHATETRDLDVMGGLARRMPVTAGCFLVGAIAICGLPPLNGFVSELLIYLGLFHTIAVDGSSPVVFAGIAAPMLALVGALAVACFVKVFGVVFLGAPRSSVVDRAHESGQAMTIPMITLAVFCFVIGIIPQSAARMLEGAVTAWQTPVGELNNAMTLGDVAPLGAISTMGVILLGLLSALTAWLIVRLRGSATGPTWDCGYAAPSPRMQYTASSFGQWLVDLFAWALRPQVQRPKLRDLFPGPQTFHSHVDDVVLDKVVRPLSRMMYRAFSYARYLQQGSIQAYLVYILVIVVGLLLWRPN